MDINIIIFLQVGYSTGMDININLFLQVGYSTGMDININIFLQVGYATAMDIYIIICFVAVFAALVEFACINFIDTFIKRFRSEFYIIKINNKPKKSHFLKFYFIRVENGRKRRRRKKRNRSLR